MKLSPHAYRELHWHQANEWAFVFNGSVRVGAMDENGQTTYVRYHLTSASVSECAGALYLTTLSPRMTSTQATFGSSHPANHTPSKPSTKVLNSSSSSTPAPSPKTTLSSLPNSSFEPLNQSSQKISAPISPRSTISPSLSSISSPAHPPLRTSQPRISPAQRALSLVIPTPTISPSKTPTSYPAAPSRSSTLLPSPSPPTSAPPSWSYSQVPCAKSTGTPIAMSGTSLSAGTRASRSSPPQRRRGRLISRRGMWGMFRFLIRIISRIRGMWMWCFWRCCRRPNLRVSIKYPFH